MAVSIDWCRRRANPSDLLPRLSAVLNSQLEFNQFVDGQALACLLDLIELFRKMKLLHGFPPRRKAGNLKRGGFVDGRSVLFEGAINEEPQPSLWKAFR